MLLLLLLRYRRFCSAFVLIMRLQKSQLTCISKAVARLYTYLYCTALLPCRAVCDTLLYGTLRHTRTAQGGGTRPTPPRVHAKYQDQARLRGAGRGSARSGQPGAPPPTQPRSKPKDVVIFAKLFNFFINHRAFRNIPMSPKQKKLITVPELVRPRSLS